MKKLFLVPLLFIFNNNLQAQEIDSLKIQKPISYKVFIVPAVLVTSGIFLVNSSLNDKIQNNAQDLFGKNFSTNVDDFLPFVPVGQIYLGNALGFQSKNTFKQQTINLAVANVMSYGVVMVMKHTLKEERPDLTDNLSFPSGHTAIAFTTASLLFYEYKDSNIWYASSGYLFATATGVLRVANNRHYTSDVLTGAGIGIASGILVSHWNPFKNLKLGKSKKTTAFIFPQIGNQIGFGAILKPNF